MRIGNMFPKSSKCQTTLETIFQIIFKIIFQIIFEMIFVKFWMLWSSCRADMWQQNAHTENTQTVTARASLLTVRALLPAVEAFCLQWGYVSEHLNLL